jgi:2-keto-4-pentenoate hydratase/2-oxohepta-3-ene-1,7-dioic acid hydratase in catechol pathway
VAQTKRWIFCALGLALIKEFYLKFGRFKKDDKIFYGTVEDDHVREITGDIFGQYTILNKKLSLKEVENLAPCMPSKIIAVGLNYRSHAEEVKMELPEEPILFLKPSTAVIGHEQNVLYPAMSKQVDYEGELGVVIGRECRSVSIGQAPDYIFGYTCFNDVTARDLQKKDKQWSRAKGFDTFAPMGPFIETDFDPANALIETYLNGEKKQSGSTSDLIFSVFFLVSFISHVMSLLPGDVIATGTPSGIGPMQAGDVVEVRIEGIGTLRNKVTNRELL